MVEATIEDLAITTRSSRESDAVRRRCCIEHDKNLHGSKTIPKSRYKAFCDITEIEMLPLKNTKPGVEQIIPAERRIGSFRDLEEMLFRD
jgi:hypothetical protein